MHVECKRGSTKLHKKHLDTFVSLTMNDLSMQFLTSGICYPANIWSLMVFLGTIGLVWRGFMLFVEDATRCEPQLNARSLKGILQM